MQTFKLANANASVIAVTGTATLIQALIDTAGATTHDFWSNMDAVTLVIEDGDIRALWGGNTPTSTKGVLMKSGSVYNLRHIRTDQLRLISVSGSNVAVSVQIGRSDPGESTSVGAAGAAGAGADTTNNLTVVEERYSYSRKTADGQVKGAAGFIHAVTISPTVASPTAGVLTIYDSASETGTVVFSTYIDTTFDSPVTVILDVLVATGIYVGFDATLANVAVTVSYR